MQEEVDAFRLGTNFDISDFCPRLNSQGSQMIMVSVQKRPPAQQLHVVPCWIILAKISNYHFTSISRKS